MNTKLDLRAASAAVGNRFWNCHIGVRGIFPYYFDIEHALFRSTQTSTNTAGVLPGNTGIQLNTNRAQYRIVRNEFTNLRTGINIPMVAAAYSVSGTSGTGIYAANISIQQNTLSAGTSTAVSPYMNRAIYMTAPNQASWTINSVTNISPFTLGVIIADNDVRDSWDGISVSGIRNWRTLIENNHIRIAENGTVPAQRGIAFTASDVTPPGYSIIRGNDVHAVGTNTLTNPQLSMIYLSNNMGPFLGQPSVACNTVYDAYNGFVFSDQNQGTSWQGNKMQNLAQGIFLTDDGYIGTQGSNTLAAGNKWDGTWTANVNYGIFTYNSFANQSPIYVQSTGTPNFPPNLSGNPALDSYAGISNGPIISASGSAFNCVSPTLRINNPIIPDPSNFTTDESYYIAILALYRFLGQNDSLKGTSISLTNFYNSLSGSSVREFSKTENYLMINDLSNASSVISGITPTNSIESNCISFYNLYINYASNRFEHTTSGDQSDLESLASGCPGTDGPGVHQARSLHNTVYNSANIWATCSGSGARTAQLISQSVRNAYLQLYPNPAQNQVIISGVPFDKWVNIQISDLSGRIVMVKSIKADGIIAKLDLELINGAYLVRINDSSNEPVVKKLLIAK